MTKPAQVHKSDLVQTYLDHLAAENATPPNTLAARARTLRSLLDAGAATREQVEAWWLTRAGLAPASRANDLANLRTFYRWCAIWEHRDDDPTRRLTAPKVDKGLPKWISKADLSTLLTTLSPDMRRAVCLGAYAGLRVSEVAALDWSDVDCETRRMRVLGKGNKSRLVAMSVLLVDELLPDTQANVVTGQDRRYSAGVLQRKVNRAIQAAGVQATFHRLRHRYGTMAYQATGDLLAVGRQMGHSSPATTSIYAAASDEMADVIAEAVTR